MVSHKCFPKGPKINKENLKISLQDLSGVIRANRFARFARITRFARIGKSSDSCESAWRAIKIGGFNCEWFARSDSRESRCESPVPLSPSSIELFMRNVLSEIWMRGHWRRGICIKLSAIDFRLCDKFAPIVRTLRVMYEMKYQHFGANLARSLRQICAMPPSRTPPSQDFWSQGVHAHLATRSLNFLLSFCF